MLKTEKEMIANIMFYNNNLPFKDNLSIEEIKEYYLKERLGNDNIKYHQTSRKKT